MRQLLNKPWFVAALAVGAVVLVGAKFADLSALRGSSPTAESTAEETLSTDETGATSTDASGLLAALEQLTRPDVVRDPFAAPPPPAAIVQPEAGADTESASETFLLSAVWIQDDACFALLNQRICRPGDAVGLVTLESITREGAWLRHPRGREFLHVGRQLVVIPPPRPAATTARLASARES